MNRIPGTKSSSEYMNQKEKRHIYSAVSERKGSIKAWPRSLRFVKPMTTSSRRLTLQNIADKKVKIYNTTTEEQRAIVMTGLERQSFHIANALPAMKPTTPSLRLSRVQATASAYASTRRLSCGRTFSMSLRSHNAPREAVEWRKSSAFLQPTEILKKTRSPCS